MAYKVNTFIAVLLLIAVSSAQETKSAITCENGSVRIECNKNERLSIVGGNYGRRNAEVCKGEKNNNCVNRDSVNILKQRCDGRQTCVVAASNDVFGDACFYTIKYLEVLYKCVPEVKCELGELKCDDDRCIPNSRICDGYTDCSGGEDEINCSYRTAYGCQAGGLNVECKEGEIIHVIKGNYGRTSKDICERSIHSDCISTAATNVLKQRCDLMRSCSVPANTTIFGDPCAQVDDKYIELQYTCWSIPANFV